MLKTEHGAHLYCHGLLGETHIFFCIALAQLRRLLQAETNRDVTIERVVRGGLIGHQVGEHVSVEDLREHFRRVAQQAHRYCLIVFAGMAYQVQRFIQRIRTVIQITGFQAFFDPRIIDFDRQATQSCKRGCQWLRATHAAEPTGQKPASVRVAIEMLAHGFGKGFIGTLHDALGADIDP